MRNNLEQVRQEQLANFCQVILLDWEGRVVESCNSIFDATQFSDKPAYEWFPFIESVFPNLPVLQNGKTPELLYSKVEKPAGFLQGFYDFVFTKKNLDGKERILWEIYDYTTLYKDFQEYQQKRNELEIQRQIYAIENKKLKTLQDISKRKISSYKRKPRTTAFDKTNINYSNILDMAVKTLSSYSGSNGGKHLDSLENISAYIQKIIDELPEREVNLSLAQSGQEREFSLENLLYDSLPYIHSSNIDIIEANVAEELPRRLLGNPLDLKRIIVGLALNVSNCYKECEMHIKLYLHDRTKDKCVVGIQVIARSGEELQPDMMGIILRLAVIKRIVELHQGSLEMETETGTYARTTCHIPFLLCE